MKKVIKNHIRTGNIIVVDGWSAYTLLYSGYIHSMHNLNINNLYDL